MENINKPNRNKTKEPKKGIFWCSSCDMSLVSDGAKCPVCGKRNGRRRLKKEPDPYAEE